MKRKTCKVVLTALSAILIMTPVYAELYKGVDADGNVVYSDKPFENAESITPPELSVMDAPKMDQPAEQTQATEKEEKGETTYTRLRITSPDSNETIWNQDRLNVKMRSTPKLAVDEGHTASLFMDGRPLIKNSGSTNFVVGRPDRGPHTFQGVIRSKDGKILVRSQKVQVFIKQHSIQKKAR